MTTATEVMTRGVRTMTPSDTVALAAQAMEELNVGAIPVCDGDRLLGMVTDRDIVVRGVAQGLDGKSTPLSSVMSTGVRTVREGDDVDDVLSKMADNQIRRLPVIDGDNRLVGIISLGDLATKDPGDEADIGESLGTISSPSEPDRTGQSQASGAAGGGSASGKPARKSGKKG
ncbi:CBS domain-containing protein [Polaromonas sp.]|uniref:CBS domain-containing protein n=1 Tax=Polaromonas sp. TaxID=1869339 RepID=UPI003CC1E4AA